MVCIRCEMVVKYAFEKMGVNYNWVKIGEAEVIDELSEEQQTELNKRLKKSGLELLEDKKAVLVEKIKNVIIELVHYTEDQIKVNLSDLLTEKLDYDYTYLANLFMEVKGTTIEHFFIFHRIERAKEFLVYDQLTLTEISYRLHYSSVAHLSAQFKKVTGLTPSEFKKLKTIRRATIENV
ncbi:MAG: AraC family transcriptional regulator [Bacteroidales bacterium]|nr:AraC family transcriptional regulator [Bacteroidales bacterium]